MTDSTKSLVKVSRKNRFIEFNTTYCVACGRCTEDCVGGVLTMHGGLPQVIEERSSFCVRCGHCVSVCPVNAITLDGRNSSELRHVTDFCTGEAGLSLLTERRAIRRYSGSIVNEELLKKAIYYAGYAPTAHNYRQVEYIVINGRKKVEDLLQKAISHMEKHDICISHVENMRKGRDTLFRGAPCIILIHAPDRILSETDCAIASAYLELALHCLGLGSCWVGILLESFMYGLPVGLNIPAGHKLYGAVLVGTPQSLYERVPFRAMPQVEWL